MRITRRDIKIILFFIFAFIVLSATVLISNFYLNRKKLTVQSQAQTVGFCQDKCIGQDRCGNGPPGDPNYNDPCCQTLKQTGNPFACPWPQRGYCTDDQCNAIPAGVNRERCGAPRHSWCNLCIQNGCPGYVSNPSSPPQPTNPPNPTNRPRPTSTPSPRPTSPPFATATPYQFPTDTSYPTNPPFENLSPTAPFTQPTPIPQITQELSF